MILAPVVRRLLTMSAFATCALLGALLFTPAAFGAEGGDEPLETRLKREIKSSNKAIEALEKELDEQSTALGEDLTNSSILARLQQLRLQLFLERALNDARRQFRDSVQDAYAELRSVSDGATDKDVVRAQLDEHFDSVVERWFQMRMARWELAGAFSDGDRRKAEEELTVRETELGRARQSMLAFLAQHQMDETAANLP